MQRILGIDPGRVSGAWAILDKLGRIISTGDLPVAGTRAQRITSAFFAAVIEPFEPATTCIERVGPMPKQGALSTFKFDRGVGVVAGAIIPVIYVRLLAIQTWPESANLHFNGKRHHCRAEPALFALWRATVKAVAWSEEKRPC